MPLSFMRDTVTIRRAPLTVKSGMETRDWSQASEHTVGNVQVVAQSTARDFEGRTQQSSTRYTLRAMYDADIQMGDRIVWNGDVFEIDGEVFRTKSPTGRVSSTRCTLTRWCG